MFLMDLKVVRMDDFPGFYNRLSKVWRLFTQGRWATCSSVFWLLEELVISGTHFGCEAGPQLDQKMHKACVIPLGQLVNRCGPRFDNAAALARHAGVRSVRVLNQLL